MEKEQKIQRDNKYRQTVFTTIVIVLLCLIGGTMILEEEDAQRQSNPALKRRMTNDKILTDAKFDDNKLVEEEGPTENELQQKVDELDREVRELKKTVPIMQTDPKSLETTKKLQDATRKLIKKRYGPYEPYRVRVDLEFQPTMPDFDENGSEGSILIEMAPTSLIPHSVYTFLEEGRNWMTGRWTKGAFHRTAGHVLQVTVGFGNPVKHLAFQEYSEKYPHKKGTVGYCGRPSGPCWYVSIMDNTRNHGPGSQQKENPYEADACFGRVIEGFEDVVLKRITKMPGGPGFINDPKKHVLIKKMTIYVPAGEDAADGYVEWEPTTGMDEKAIE